MSFDEWHDSDEHARAAAQEDAWFERNRVEISLGTLLFLTWWFMPRLVALVCLGLLVAFAVLRRVPQALPTLRFIWRVCLMPLAKIDDWIMARWRAFKIVLGKRMVAMQADWQVLQEWLRLALKREKDDRVVSAMAYHQGFVSGRVLSPLNVLGRWIPAIAFGIGMLLAGSVQSWRIHNIKEKLSEATESAQSWQAEAKQARADAAAIAIQRNADVNAANARALETAELLRAERERVEQLSTRERRRRNEAQRAAAGGPPPDFERSLRDIANPQAGAAPGADAAPAAGGDRPG
ncbi:MAG: hypothetical protein EBR82_07970 [Caulobacteraceae bacterium]|nr:hypothetical protein [Caulobacteraceae bacterium]